MQRIVIKHNNQHRRTRYWQSFRQVLRVGVHIVDALLSPLAALGTAASAASLQRGVSECASAEEACRALCARVSAPHQGAGFAPLAATLLASCAQVWQCMGQARQALQAGQGQGVAGTALSTKVQAQAQAQAIAAPQPSSTSTLPLPLPLPVPGAAAQARRKRAREGKDYIIDKGGVQPAQ